MTQVTGTEIFVAARPVPETRHGSFSAPCSRSCPVGEVMVPESSRINARNSSYRSYCLLAGVTTMSPDYITAVLRLGKIGAVLAVSCFC